MGAYTVHVQEAGAYLEADHVEAMAAGHQMTLTRILAELPKTHALAWCGGCLWYLRWPKRDVDTLHVFAHQHLGQDHLSDLLSGRATIDPDLADGGAAWLRARIDAIVAGVGR